MAVIRARIAEQAPSHVVGDGPDTLSARRRAGEVTCSNYVRRRMLFE